jgi:UDP-GlcNAc:undecaprenyl-phosphate GlcNAc-1-phosphate transferase
VRTSPKTVPAAVAAAPVVATVATSAVTSALLAGGIARLAYRRLALRPPGGAKVWSRTNHRGDALTLLEGPAVAFGIGTAALLVPGLPASVRIAGSGAAIGAGAVGLYDDLRGDSSSKGFGGHLKALARGRVTTGAVKILGIGAVGMGAGCLLRRGPGDGAVDRVLAGVVVAGVANAVNLFDLRPGRAAKVALIAGLPGALRGGPAGVLGAATLGAAVALLPEDLGERAMLGDAGANALGAALGVASVARSSRSGLVASAIALVALTAASEKVSFTRVIASNRPLRLLDELGRRSA